jgi:carbamoyl-phosphate synthase large subunit
MQHIEEAGVHSGDSACMLPPYEVSAYHLDHRDGEGQTSALALELGVIGLMNVQFAIRDDIVFLLEVNPRASRTVPFVSKAIGVPLARIAARSWPARSSASWACRRPGSILLRQGSRCCPSKSSPAWTPSSGRRCAAPARSWASTATWAWPSPRARSPRATRLPDGGTVFLSLNQRDKAQLRQPGQGSCGTSLASRSSPPAAPRACSVNRASKYKNVSKVGEGRPNVVDAIINGEVDWIVNTPLGMASVYDERAIRRTALEYNLPMMTTLAAARAAVQTIQAMAEGAIEIRSLQEYHAGTAHE